MASALDQNKHSSPQPWPPAAGADPLGSADVAKAGVALAPGGGGKRKRLTALAIAFLTFSCVAGGPFGIEVAVQSAGAFATIVGLLIAGLLWGMPQALITAELAAAIPANGGPVVWVHRAMGRRWGFVNGLLLCFNQITDVVLYPTLVASYIGALWPALNSYELYAVKVAALLCTVTLNIIGVDAISASAALLTAVIMLPFALLPAVAAGEGLDFNWAAVGPSGTPAGWQSNLAIFASTILWNMQGWSEMGCVAGEVEQAEKVFPKGMAIAAGLVTFAYSAPVLFGVALSPDVASWADGYFVQLARSVAPWLAALVLLSAALANLSTFLTSMAAYSRTLQAVARQGIVPIPLLSRNMTRYRTPVPCILFLGATTLALMAGLDFTQLVVVDSSFYLLSQASVIVSFVRLRYSEPELHRPYLFPGGIVGVWIAVPVTLLLAAFALYSAADGVWQAGAAVGGAVVLLMALSFLWSSACCKGLVDRAITAGEAAAAEDDEGSICSDDAAADLEGGTGAGGVGSVVKGQGGAGDPRVPSRDPVARSASSSDADSPRFLDEASTHLLA